MFHGLDGRYRLYTFRLGFVHQRSTKRFGIKLKFKYLTKKIIIKIFYKKYFKWAWYRGTGKENHRSVFEEC